LDSAKSDAAKRFESTDEGKKAVAELLAAQNDLDNASDSNREQAADRKMDAQQRFRLLRDAAVSRDPNVVSAMASNSDASLQYKQAVDQEKAVAAKASSLELKADAPENVKAFVRACEGGKQKCQADILASRQALSKAQAKPVGPNSNGGAYGSADEKKRAVDGARARLLSNEQKLKAIEGGDFLLAAPHLSLDTGQIGTMPGYVVAHIVDSSNMLAHFYIDAVENDGTDTMPVWVETLKPMDDLVWFEEIDTAGMTDNSKSTKLLLFEVGSNTVKLVRPFDIKPYLAE
jgi:hypothetical protein